MAWRVIAGIITATAAITCLLQEGEEEVPGTAPFHLRPVPALGPGSPLRPPPLRVVRDHLLLQADQATPVRPDHTRERGGHPLRDEGGGEPSVQPDAGAEGAGAHGGNGGGGPRPSGPPPAGPEATTPKEPLPTAPSTSGVRRTPGGTCCSKWTTQTLGTSA